MSDDRKCPNCENTWPEKYGSNCPRCGHSFAAPPLLGCPWCGQPPKLWNPYTSQYHWRICCANSLCQVKASIDGPPEEIIRRWNNQRVVALLESQIEETKMLAEALAALRHPNNRIF